eukprot:TRINITY_DN15172_c0_g1_i1.p1 TRINITY_DN15172_c0_g1~~TRINITY_DN15172_c0_g1_i1.p1  ORF type:complete len:282 (-),score=29.97 TRINITY_DN15172_c0_g1_i1:41-886(-)
MRPRHKKILFISGLFLLFYFAFIKNVEEEQETRTFKKEQNHYRLVIGVESKPENFELRKTLREKAWVRYAREKYPEVLIKFVLKFPEDRSLLEQTRQEDDLIWTMDGGAFKTLTFFNWVTNMEDNNDKSFDWVMKTSEHTWVNIDLIMEELDTLYPNKKHVWGRFLKNGKRLKTPGSLYSDFDFSADKYPKYPSGTGYIISPDLVRWMSEQWESGWFWNWTNDDAGVGIYICGIFPKMTEDPRFLVSGVCKSPALLSFPHTSTSMASTQANYEKCQNPCKC